MSEVAPAASRVSLAAIALTFNHIALASFGGGLSAWSREVVVEQKKWMGEEQFLSAMTMCRIMPGATQVNLSVFVGGSLRGFAGAVAARPVVVRPSRARRRAASARRGGARIP